MEELIKNIVEKRKQEGIPNFVIKNLLKEQLQYPVLEFIYSHKNYKKFFFTGGSCLRICFGAPRLSEDLDFELTKKDWKQLDTAKMAREIENYFRDKYFLEMKAKCQGKQRIYLKFPILKKLGLAEASESDWLYVKIEPNKISFENPEEEFAPISRFGFNMVIKHYPLTVLMTGKLGAIFGRVWFKGKNNEINIKGRDFFDLFWYLEKGVSPDLRALKKSFGISDWTNLKKVLREKIEKNVTAQKLSYDLKNFFPNQSFVAEFCKNYKKIIFKYLK